MTNKFIKFKNYLLNLALDNPLIQLSADQEMRIKMESYGLGLKYGLDKQDVTYNSGSRLSLVVRSAKDKHYLKKWQTTKKHFIEYLNQAAIQHRYYFLTVNPFKANLTDLVKIAAAVNNVLRSDDRPALWYKRLATAPSYIDHGCLDYHLHFKLIATADLPIYTTKRAIKAAVSKYQRQHHELVKSSIDLRYLPNTADDVKTDSYVATQDVHPFRRATHGAAIGQTEAEIFKNLPLKRQYQLQAELYKSHAAKNYLHWNADNAGVKSYRLWKQTPLKQEIPLIKTKPQPPRPTLVSKHHYSNNELLRQEAGLNIFTGKMLKRTITKLNNRDIKRAIAINERPKPLNIKLPVQVDDERPKMDMRTNYIAKLNKYRWLRIEARAGHSD